MDDTAMLKLGDAVAPVGVRKVFEIPETVMDLADKMGRAYAKGSAWSKDMFADFGGSQILQAIRLFTEKITYESTAGGDPPYNPLELELIVSRQTVSLSLPLQHLCKWAVLVRVGVGEFRRELLGMLAMAVLPAKGTVKLNKPTEDVGCTHYAVTHVLGNVLTCRGYCLALDDSGEWRLGGSENNRWVKDVWLTPGLTTINAIVEARRKKAMRSPSAKNDPQELRRLDRLSLRFRSEAVQKRKAAGLNSEQFSKAYGARLDLENKNIMQLVLSSVRALLAQALVYRVENRLDAIAGQHGVTRSDLIEKLDSALDDSDEVKYHLEQRDASLAHFRQCGSLVVPRGYMVFASAKVPSTIPTEVRTELDGVSGTAVSAAYMLTRFDVPALRKNPAALPEVEDLSPLIDACGIPLLYGKIVEHMDPVCRDAEGVLAESGEKFMRFKLEGTDAFEELPLAAFMQKTSIRFLPMVVDYHKHRLLTEDMQGSKDGVYFAMSTDDVSTRFKKPCEYRKRSV